jgi:hypothetical protein
VQIPAKAVEVYEKYVFRWFLERQS